MKSEPLKVEQWPIDRLIEYPRNPRKNDAVVDKMVAAFTEFGFRIPIVASSDGLIVDGHLRLKAARKMGLTEVPVALADGLTEAQIKAFRLLANRSASWADWDPELLRLEMVDLKLTGMNLALTGFAPLEINKILLDPEVKRELTQNEKDELDIVWRRLFLEWHDILRDLGNRPWFSTSVTRGTMGVLFLRARLEGREIPRTATLAYTGRRILTVGDAGSLFDQLVKALDETNPARARDARDHIRWACEERPSFDAFVATSLPIQGNRVPNDFPALLARDLIEEFAPEDARILDPCHGWGGRMLGFLLSEKAESYDGFDPSPAAHDGVQLMFDDLAPFASRDKAARLIEEPFERADLQAKSYDLALTSPPYYDREKYEGEESSHRLYGSFDAWVDGFYRPMISSVSKALKPGGAFLLQVGSQIFPLAQLAIDHAPKAKLKYLETRPTGLYNNRTNTDAAQGEVIVILRK